MPDQQSAETPRTTLLHDSCENVLRDMSDECVDLIFLDPPYNLGKKFDSSIDRWESDEDYLQWCYSWLSHCVRILKRTGSLYIMNSTQNMPYIDIWIREHLHILSRIVWSYDSSGVQARKYFGSLYEPILFCVKDKKCYTFNAEAVAVEARTGAVRKLIDYRKPVPAPYSTTKVPGNVWTIPRVRYRMSEYEDHPSQKPEALLERMFRASTNPGDTILDPFAGTFTSSVVASRLGRHSIGIEREVKYYEIGRRRVGEDTAKLDAERQHRNTSDVGSTSDLEFITPGDTDDNPDRLFAIS